MRKLLVLMLSMLLIFGMATTALAMDGRNGNGIDTGLITIEVPYGSFFVGETLEVSGDVTIDGDLTTLEVFVNGIAATVSENGYAATITLPNNATESFPIVVTATTKFKNGKKAGLVHSSGSANININVEERTIIKTLIDVIVTNTYFVLGKNGKYAGFVDLQLVYNTDEIEEINDYRVGNFDAGQTRNVTVDIEDRTWEFRITQD